MAPISAELLSVLNDATEAQGYLKAGFLGFAKGGKSYTATLLACAVKRQFKLAGPISMFDSEAGSLYLKDMVLALTGEKLLAKRARSFAMLMKWGEACVKAGISVGVTDSITHPWRELCDSFLVQQNQARARYNRSPKLKLDFTDWNVIKPMWAEWTDFYLNSPLHLIICGRAGWEYEMEVNDQGKKELTKTGIKMKTESEFGFEPSLLVEMERDQELGEQHRIIRRATVLGDRFGLIDGKSGEFPSTDKPEQAMRLVWDFFKPHLEKLQPGAHAPIDTGTKTEFDVPDESDAAWQKEKRSREILCEEVQGELTSAYPGQTAAEKKAKADMLEKCFNTRSWTKIETLDQPSLRRGLEDLRKILKASRPAAEPASNETAV